jgi:hypothetical protein
MDDRITWHPDRTMNIPQPSCRGSMRAREALEARLKADMRLHAPLVAALTQQAVSGVPEPHEQQATALLRRRNMS